MFGKNFKTTCIMLAASLSVTCVGYADVFSTSLIAPTHDSDDIYILPNYTTGTTITSNASSENIGSSFPVQGQYFMTQGSYKFDSITFQSRGPSSGTGTTVSGDWTVRVIELTSINNGVATHSNTIYTNTIRTPNFSNVKETYITYTLDTPILLSPGTTYGLDWGTNGIGFIANNASITNLPNSDGYYSGISGSPNNQLNGITLNSLDRVFHISLTIPEPSAYALLLSGGALFMLLRRYRLNSTK